MVSDDSPGLQNVSEYWFEARGFPSWTLWAKHAPTLALVQNGPEGGTTLSTGPFSAPRNKTRPGWTGEHFLGAQLSWERWGNKSFGIISKFCTGDRRSGWMIKCSTRLLPDETRLHIFT